MRTGTSSAVGSGNRSRGRGGWRGIAALVCALMQALAAPAVAQTDYGIDYVIHISVDALHADGPGALVGAGQSIGFARLMSEGAWTDNARTDFNSTVTSPNHATIVTGMPVQNKVDADGNALAGHLWGENKGDPWNTYNQTSFHDPHTFSPAKSTYSYVSSTFDVAHDRGLTTGCYFNKDRIWMEYHSYATEGGPDAYLADGDQGTNKIDYYLYENSHSHPYTHEPLAQTLLDDWKANMAGPDPINYTFLHLDPPDLWGHHDTWDLTTNPMSSWMLSVKEVDDYVAQLLETIDNDISLSGRTAIVLTADHGGVVGTTGHGVVDDPGDFRVPFMVWGPGVKEGADLYALNPQYVNPGNYGRPDYDARGQPIRNGDSANVSLQLLGLPAIPGSSMNAGLTFQINSDYPSQVQGDGAVRYWRLDEIGAATEAVNIATNTTATPAQANGTYNVSPVTSAPGLLLADANTAMRFNGTQAIDIPNHADINDDGDAGTTLTYPAKTVELWFDADATGPRQVLYEQGGSTRGLNIYLDGGQLYVAAWNTTDEDAGVSTPWGGTDAAATAVQTPVTAGQAHQIVLRMDGDDAGTDGSVTGYLDGRPFGQVYGVGQLFEHSDAAAIGKQAGTTLYHDGASSSGDQNYFVGVIDDVSLYNTALRTDRVQTHAIEGMGGLSHGAYGDAVLADQPLAYWQMGEVCGNGAVNVSTVRTSGIGLGNDVDGRHAAGVLVGGASLMPAGDNGAAVYGGTGGTAVPSHAALNLSGAYDRRTVELWFNADAVTGRQVLYEEGDAADGLNVYVEGGQVHVGAWTGSGGTLFANYGAAVGAGETHQVVLTFDATNDALLGTLDGQVFAATRGITALDTHTGGIGIGYMNDGSRFAGGATGTGEAGDGRAFQGVIDDVAVYDASLSTYQVRSHLAAGGAPAALDAYETAVQADDPIAYWRLNNTAGDGAANVAAGPAGITLGNAVTGLVQNNVDRTAAALVGQSDTCAHFDGSTDTMVSLPDNAGINTTAVGQRTIELWFNAEDVNARRVLFEEGGKTNGLNVYLEDDAGSSTTGVLTIGAWTKLSDTETQNDFRQISGITPGSTHHVVLVYDATADDSMVGYLDGVAFGGFEGIDAIAAHTGNCAIGGMDNDSRFDNGTATGDQKSGNGYFFQGRIDEVALYNAPLTTRQVQTHFATGSGDRLGLPDGVALGVMVNSDANLDTNGNAAWEDTLGTRTTSGTAAAFDWALAGPTREGGDHGTPGDVSPLMPGVNFAYRFNGAGAGTTTSFQSMAGDPSNASASFEVWFKPDDFLGREILVDAGGSTDGASLILDGTLVQFIVTDGGTSGETATASFDLMTLEPALRNDFIQVVGAIDFENQDLIRLYVDGLERDAAYPVGSGAFADWCGTDGSGLGAIDGTAAADTADNFEGLISIFRFYPGELNNQQVLENYLAVAPEPATLALLGLGALALMARRRRR